MTAIQQTGLGQHDCAGAGLKKRAGCIKRSSMMHYDNISRLQVNRSILKLSGEFSAKNSIRQVEPVCISRL
jgi:hypothetical protein